MTRVYFPRLLLPLGSIATPLVDFLVVFPVLVGMTFWYEIPVGIEALLAPFFLLLAAVTAFGAGLLFAVMNVRYRDVPYALSFVISMWLWLSPVAYSGERPRGALPVAVLVEPDDGRHQWPPLVVARLTASLADGRNRHRYGRRLPRSPGLAFFRSAEPRFADTI